ncbi:MAG: zinc ribbon domain-containing protein [Candidatus Methanoculleus thermohydrogenotrophicum]
MGIRQRTMVKEDSARTRPQMGGSCRSALSPSTGPEKRVEMVNGAYTSQHPSAGTTAQTRAGFLCLACGHAENADLNAGVGTSLPGLMSTRLLRSTP